MTPRAIIHQYTRDDTLLFANMRLQHEIKFIEFCEAIEWDMVKNFAFYSVKSKGFTSEFPNLKLDTSFPIEISSGEFQKQFPKLIRWIRGQQFQKVTKSIIPLAHKYGSLNQLEFVWFALEGKPQYKFINLKYLQS